MKIHKNVYHAFCSSGRYPFQTYIWQAKIHFFCIVIYLFYFIFYSAENKSAFFRLVEMYILHVPTKEKKY